MPFRHTKQEKILKKEKFGIHIDVYPNIGNCGVVILNTQSGHNQEFYDVQSTFNYIILEGKGTFFLNDEEVLVKQGDLISVPPKTRIYYKGKMKLVLVTQPAWKAENEVETRSQIW